MMNPPMFQKFSLADGSVLLVKICAVCQVERSEVNHWTECAKRFNKNAVQYNLASDSATRVIAGLINEFSSESVNRNDVVEWAAFVNMERTPQDVSVALGILKDKPNQPVTEITDGGPGSMWRINRDALKKYLDSV